MTQGKIKKRITKNNSTINCKRFKMATNTYLSKIILNVNGLKAPTKRQRGVDQIGGKKKNKQEPTKFCLQQTHFRVKDK